MSLIRKNSGKEKEKKGRAKKESGDIFSLDEKKKLHRFVVGNETEIERARMCTVHRACLEVCLNNEGRLINIFAGRIRSRAPARSAEWRFYKLQQHRVMNRRRKKWRQIFYCLSPGLVCLSQFVAYCKCTCSLWVSRQISRLIARAVSTQRYALQKQVVMSLKWQSMEMKDAGWKEAEKRRVETRNICTNES